MKFVDVPQSGSFAGNTHSHNRAGQYRRNRRAPVQPIGTGRRAFIRSSFGAASTRWGTLTAAQQAAWAAAADSHPYTDRLGQTFKLTGHQMFVAINVQRYNVGATILTVPPTSWDAGVITDPSLTATAGTPTLSVTFSAPTVTTYVLVSFAPPQSSGRNFVNNFWQSSVESATGSPVDALASFTAQFGALSVGQRIFCKLTPVSTDGVTGTPTIFSKQITA
jgi:hypothetical protein